MFKIAQLDDYAPEHCKVHFASTKEIAEEVKRDLESRFGEMVLTEEEENECCWDPGGMMMTDDEVFSFLLDNITINCKAQHFDYFVGSTQGYESRGNETKYIKLHGHWTCICITPTEYERLQMLYQDADFAKRAKKSWEERERRLNKLAEAGSIKRVVKGSDGKLYEKKPVVNPIDKKLLN